MTTTIAAKPAGDKTVSNELLRINEIFFSLQGESSKTGLPTIFIRLTGCPLRCTYCDTEYAFHGGEKLAIETILERISTYQTRHVCVTGGEPLAQQSCPSLLTALCDEGYQVSLETSGAMDVAGVDQRVLKVLDLKTPASGEADNNLFSNLDLLCSNDQVKFVICNRDDYDWVRDIIRTHQLTDRCEVLLSPSHDELPARQLADWILADQLPVRMQVQLHKYLWGDGPGH